MLGTAAGVVCLDIIASPVGQQRPHETGVQSVVNLLRLAAAGHLYQAHHKAQQRMEGRQWGQTAYLQMHCCCFLRL
jgi:hypothetical protein